MSKTASVIEINGTIYDAATGKVIGAVKSVATQVKDQSKNVDGFVRKSNPVRHVKSARLVHAKAQKSKALMRTSVSKPKPEPAKPSLIKPSLSKAVIVEQERRSRASAIMRSKHVNRFGAPKPARPRPVRQAHHSRTTVVAKARPVAQAASAVARPMMPSMVASASHQRLERLLDEALVRADAHKETLRRRSRNPLNHLGRMPRWLSVSIILLVVLLIAIFIIWRDVPAVAVKVAGTQAHVDASLPSYAPSGFSVAGSVGHSGGSVDLTYKNAAGASYDLTQRSSSWDSRSLAANVLASTSGVQTSQVQGMTVYIYGPSNDATWVNNGVWYSLTNHANLSSDQILRIVQSL